MNVSFTQTNTLIGVELLDIFTLCLEDWLSICIHNFQPNLVGQFWSDCEGNQLLLHHVDGTLRDWTFSNVRLNYNRISAHAQRVIVLSWSVILSVCL